MSDVFPTENGRCPRCTAGSQGTNVFCSECSLRLQTGTFGLEARANLVSAGWMQANPELAEAWRRRLEASDTEVASQRKADDLRHRELDEALADLEKWALRARLLGQVASEAYERAMQA